MKNGDSEKKISIAIADDHVLLRWGILKMLAMQDRFQPLFDVSSGVEVIEKLQNDLIPDILLLDINMPDMDGEQTTSQVSRLFPSVKILVLSMFADECTIVRLIKAGAKGYVTKDSMPEKLADAIRVVYEDGVYFSDNMSRAIAFGIQHNLFQEEEKKPELRDNEKIFLSLLCQQLSYVKIAERMYLSKRTIHDYSNNLSKKLNVKGKTGLLLYAMSNGYNEAL